MEGERDARRDDGKDGGKNDGRPPSADGLRSTKKVRIRVDGMDGGMVGDAVISDVVMEEKGAIGGTSYRNKLLNVNSDGMGNGPLNDASITDADFMISSYGNILSIEFTKQVRDVLAKGMERTLVIKLLGRSVTYFNLLHRIRMLWKVRGSYQLVDVEGGFFFVTFDLEEDYMKILTRGPWMVFGAYLIVQPWSLDFDPRTANVSNAVVWLRIPGLSFRYYHKCTLRAIGRLLGEVVKIDYMTETQGRGRYSQIAVLVDLQKPLIPWIKVEGRTYGVEYEGLPLICFECGKYGHTKEKCQLRIQKDSSVAAGLQATSAEGSSGPKSGEERLSFAGKRLPEPGELPFGEWMQVRYPKKGNKHKVGKEAKVMGSQI
ncbi:hypothetical protein K1719_034310 [Acacia pycnantha]|nr:hypothetical protein K1719_034310 [Acacia pycnantha]